MNSQPDADDLTAVLDRLIEQTDGRDLSFKDLVGVFGQRAFGPLLLIPAVIAVAPTGAIPGMSLLTGSMICLLALQLFMGRKNPWLPKRLLEYSFSRDQFVGAARAVRPYTKLIDRGIRPRLTIFAKTPFIYLIALVTFFLGLSMFPLALLPFAVAVPGTSIAVLALGLTSRDGVVILLGLMLIAGFLAAGVIVFDQALVPALTNVI